MDYSERDFQILDVLDQHEISSQRQLSEHAGISLGQVNYALKSLLEKGFVKLGNFNRNPRKISYVYILTPTGVKEKARLAAIFFLAKLREYNTLRRLVAEKMIAIEKKGFSRIVIVGPEILGQFFKTLIEEGHGKLTLVGHCIHWKDLNDHSGETFDAVLLWYGNQDDIETISKETSISKKGSSGESVGLNSQYFI